MGHRKNQKATEADDKIKRDSLVYPQVNIVLPIKQQKFLAFQKPHCSGESKVESLTLKLMKYNNCYLEQRRRH
jgi:hypothetical protein